MIIPLCRVVQAGRVHLAAGHVEVVLGKGRGHLRGGAELEGVVGSGPEAGRVVGGDAGGGALGAAAVDAGRERAEAVVSQGGGRGEDAVYGS